MNTQPLRVLLVDDEEELVSALVERLGLRGIYAEAVTRGVEALELITEHDYDVVVLDLKLPDMDGIEVMSKIRELRPGLPVVIFTGHGAVDKAEQANLNQAFDYLAKPAEIEDFIDKLRSAAAGSFRSKG